MKKLIYLSFLLLSIYACDKENGGGIFNPCKDVVCENGGFCDDGQCSCTIGYEGARCARERKPDFVTIKTVEIRKFPDRRDSGSTWDFLDNADIYIAIFNYNEDLVFSNRSEFIEDASSGNDYIFDINYSADRPERRYDIILYDKDDFGSDEYLTGFRITPYFKDEGFPTTILLEISDTEFTLEIEYIWL